MSDIFVSYAHQDRTWVARFAESLNQAGGFDIWWDHHILPGEQFDDAIQAAMDSTRCVVVVWSKTSIVSRWVRTEAREAARRNILVPVMIERVMPPLEFRSFETADISDWEGELDHSNFRELTEALRLAIARNAGANRPGPQPGPPTPLQPAQGVHRTRAFPAGSWKAYAIGGAIAAALLVVALIGASVLRQPARTPAADGPAPVQTATTPPAPVSNPLPNLTYGVWTLHNAIDDDKNNWNNSVIKFTSQEEVADGLALRGTFSWRWDNTLVGTEEFTGHYVRASRQIFLEGVSVQDVPHAGTARLTIGSYSAVVAPDERALVNGRWGQSARSEPGVLGRWEASR